MVLKLPLPPPFPSTIECFDFSFTNKWGAHEASFYYERSSKEPSPLLIFAHGLGASKDYYRWMVESLTNHGYVVLAYTLPGNVVTQLFTILKGMFPTGKVNFNTFLDAISDSINKLEAMDALSRFIDFERIGAVGHSGGAAGVLRESAKDDTRLRCIVALAPPPYYQTRMPRKVTIPVQVQIGTLDRLCPLEGVKDYYLKLEAPVKHLVVIEGGNHVQFMDHEMAELPVRLGIDKKPETLTEEVHKQCEAGLLYWFDRHFR